MENQNKLYPKTYKKWDSVLPGMDVSIYKVDGVIGKRWEISHHGCCVDYVRFNNERADEKGKYDHGKICQRCYNFRMGIIGICVVVHPMVSPSYYGD